MACYRRVEEAIKLNRAMQYGGIDHGSQRLTRVSYNGLVLCFGCHCQCVTNICRTAYCLLRAFRFTQCPRDEMGLADWNTSCNDMYMDAFLVSTSFPASGPNLLQ